MPVEQHSNALLIQAQEERGLSNRQLARELQRQAALEGHPVAEVESLVSLLSRWRNGRQQPDAFHRLLLRKALGKTDKELGLQPLDGESAMEPADGHDRAKTTGQFVVDLDHASLEYADGRYHLEQTRRLINLSDEPITRYLIRIAVDRYPGEPERSNEHYRRNPLTLGEVNLQACCEDEPMAWEVKHDRDSFKELWLLFENDQAKFPLYPGEMRTIRYSYAVGDDKWGRWFQRAIRLPTRRLSVRLTFPTSLEPEPWGTETSLTMGSLALRTPVAREVTRDKTVFTWETGHPPLNARYRFEWRFRAIDPPTKDWPRTMSGAELTARLRDMGVRQKGDPILRQVAKLFDLPAEADEAAALQEELLRYLERLQRIYPFNKGMGLAAPQIGVSRAMAVIKPPKGEPLVLVNPVVVERSPEEDEHFEGCLSFFDVRGIVARPRSARVEIASLDGQRRMEVLDRGIARLAMHEIDHLEGKLYVDQLKPGTRVISLDDYRERDTAWQYESS
ncbi:MAG TPA: peptide deformylase [Actinomycetota bacterium]|nr:peptide deformylase [Actinomycetota bacterium]